MKFFTLLLAILSFNILGSEDFKDVFTQYADLQSALANDHFDHAKMSATKLGRIVGKVNTGSLSEASRKAWSHHTDALKTALSDASKAATIKELRTQFNTISNVLISLRMSNGSEGLNQFHCPMAFGGKGADWLQTGDSTMNPYYGSAMLKCGTMVKK